MPQSIYQKYRPQTWADIADQQHIKLTLEHEIQRGELSHAYLFVGPRGVGKTTTARLFAKAINCLKRTKNSAEPCNACESCERIQRGQSLDIIEIDAASHTGVDHVREAILDSVGVAAGHGRYRVFIIDEVHMLSTAAFNAMLKVLEEPPAHVVFILATTEAHKVPATIISRCQRFDFKRIPSAAVIDRLRKIAVSENVTVDDNVLDAVASRAEGSLRDAESIFGQLLALGVSHITSDEASLVVPTSDTARVAEFIADCFKGDASSGLALLHTLAEDGVSLPLFMTDCIGWLRGLLLIKASNQLDVFTEHHLGPQREALVSQASMIDLERLRRIIDIFLARRRTVAEAPIPELGLELALVEACEGSGVAHVTAPAPAKMKQSDAPKKLKEETPPVLEKTFAPTEVSPIAADASINLPHEAVMGRWPDILERVKNVNHALSFVLMSALPVAVESGVLKVSVRYAFHRDRVGEAKNAEVLSGIASDVLGQRIVVRPMLLDDAQES